MIGSVSLLSLPASSSIAVAGNGLACRAVVRLASVRSPTDRSGSPRLSTRMRPRSRARSSSSLRRHMKRLLCASRSSASRVGMSMLAVPPLIGRILADGRSRQHDVLRLAVTRWSATSSSSSCPRSLDFDVTLPTAKTALPSSLRLRSRDARGKVEATAEIEWSGAPVLSASLSRQSSRPSSLPVAAIALRLPSLSRRPRSPTIRPCSRSRPRVPPRLFSTPVGAASRSV